MHDNFVIAIDGPAGSGKSTVAKMVAARLGALYLDSGALYRAVTLLVLRHKLAPGRDTDPIVELLKSSTIELNNSDKGTFIFLDGEDVTSEIRSQEVTALVSEVSENLAIREVVTGRLHDLAQFRSVVMDGRDIGTVVFPAADLKIFLTASLAERARRRHLELQQCGTVIEFTALQEEISRRDKYDSERKVAPLKRAEDAILLDTSNLNSIQVSDRIVDIFAKLSMDLTTN